MALALVQRMELTAKRRVQREREVSVFGSVAKSALAGLLAVLLLVAATLAASHALHQSFHAGRASASHLCLICSFTKGQVTTAEIAPALAVFVSIVIFSLPLVRVSKLPVTDRRLAHSRGPPSILSASRVVG